MCEEEEVERYHEHGGRVPVAASLVDLLAVSVERIGWEISLVASLSSLHRTEDSGMVM